MSDTVLCQPVNHSLSDSAHHSSFLRKTGRNLPHPLLLLLFLILLVFLLKPSAPTSLPALLSICRCDRGGRCVHNAAGVWLLGCIFQRANRYRLLFSPSKLFIHTDKQGEKGDVRSRGKEEEEEKSERPESFSFLSFSLPRLSLLYPLWTHRLASGSNWGGKDRKREAKREKRRAGG